MYTFTGVRRMGAFSMSGRGTTTGLMLPLEEPDIGTTL